MTEVDWRVERKPNGTYRKPEMGDLLKKMAELMPLIGTVGVASHLLQFVEHKSESKRGMSSAQMDLNKFMGADRYGRQKG